MRLRRGATASIVDTSTGDDVRAAAWDGLLSAAGSDVVIRAARASDVAASQPR